MAGPSLDAFLDSLRERIVETVARTTPDLPAQGGVEAVRREVAELIEHLAVAVELEAPRLFAAHVTWAWALAGRRGRLSVLGRSLQVTEDLLRSAASGPGGAGQAIRRESLRLALETVASVQALPLPRPEAAREVAAYLAEAAGGRRAEALARVERWRGDEGPVAALRRLAEAQREAGERWFSGDISVAIEHRITAVSAAALPCLAPPPGGEGRAVFACAPGDNHAMGPAIAGALLGHHGWAVENLGADTPSAALARRVAEVEPDLIGIGVGPLLALAGAREAARAARAAWPRATLVAGGWAARVSGAELLGVDRIEAETYGGEPPAAPGPTEGEPAGPA